jgi:polyisoprenoid-binding protein YceI
MRRRIFLSMALLISTEIAFSKPLGVASFYAEGKGLAIDINGEGATIDGEVKKEGTKITGGELKVKLKDFKTGIEERDKHMCSALECDKFPEASFKLQAAELKAGSPILGEMTLHGVTKKLAGWKVESLAGGKVKAKGNINLKEFGIEPPSYKVAKVSDNVEVTVELTI